MKEKLIAELQGLADMMPPICDRDRPATVLIFDTPVTVHCKPFEQFQDVLRRAADALADDGVTAQEWIPVTERLPDRDDTIVVFHETMRDTSAAIQIYKAWAMSDTATHWIPLPAPPKGE